MRVLVTPRSLTAAPDHPALAPLRAEGWELVSGPPGRLPEEAELLELVPGCHGWLAGVERIGPRVFAAAEALRVISRNGAGVEAIDAPSAARHGVRVLTAAGANAAGVAELTLGLMLGLARHISAADAAMKRKCWQRPAGIELGGRTLGLIGCGAVGSRVARLALAVGMRVRAFDVAGPFACEGDFAFESTPEAVFRSADVLSLHCPPRPEGPWIDEASLAWLKPGTLLVNTARASLVDEKAVLAALESGRLAGYGTDVTDGEPPHDWTLATHLRVLATPHLGANTAESIARATAAAVENLRTALLGG